MKIEYLGNTDKKSIENTMRYVASAGLLSRAKGKVFDVIESRNDYEKNVNVIKNITGYGHNSITEHQYLLFGLEDVTPIVEQTLINHRLTSFTIKSRRNVDFRNEGFYVPNFKYKDGSIVKDNEYYQNKYKEYMKNLFLKYGNLVDQQLPIEDCRYILPYCYHSTFFMGCNANELLKIVTRLKYGEESKITELYDLGCKFEEIMQVITPYFIDKLNKEKDNIKYQDNFSFLDNYIDINDKLLDRAHLTSYTNSPDLNVCISILKNRYQLSDTDAIKVLQKLKLEDNDIEKKMVDGLLKNAKIRELEQVNFSYEMPISLASLTHITRHRMHSLMVPSFVPLWNFNNYVIPKSIQGDSLEEYKEVFNNNSKMMQTFKDVGIRDEDLIYFYLSGHACNISTTMNARNLMWISRMRCCNKAQWEIRDRINECVNDTIQVAPLIGSLLGPTCKVEGYCPEGKDSCKNGPVIIKKK